MFIRDTLYSVGPGVEWLYKNRKKSQNLEYGIRLNAVHSWTLFKNGESPNTYFK